MCEFSMTPLRFKFLRQANEVCASVAVGAVDLSPLSVLVGRAAAARALRSARFMCGACVRAQRSFLVRATQCLSLGHIIYIFKLQRTHNICEIYLNYQIMVKMAFSASPIMRSLVSIQNPPGRKSPRSRPANSPTPSSSTGHAPA